MKQPQAKKRTQSETFLLAIDILTEKNKKQESKIEDLMKWNNFWFENAKFWRERLITEEKLTKDILGDYNRLAGTANTGNISASNSKISSNNFLKIVKS